MDFDRSSMPKLMREQADKMVGVKVKGKGTDEVKLEHFDFCVESTNKTLKMNLASAPSKIAWLISCRTYELLRNLIENCSKLLHYIR